MSSTADLIVTKKRLTEWGNWCYRIITMGLGFSNQSLIAKLHAEGGIIINGTAKILLPTNKDAEEIDTLIEKLAHNKPEGKGKPDWANIIRIHYTMPEKEIKERIQIASISERSYYRYLKNGQSWLSDQLHNN